MKRRLGLVLCVLAVVAALVVVVVGRGSNPANTLPRLASGGSSTLYVDFVSVVNLPLGARVLSRGTQIGTVDDIDLVPNAARLTLGLEPEAQLPVGTRAELRQLTMLGDIYVALTPPTDDTGEMLGDGDVINLADTDPGPQIEDIITNLADFLAGGSLMRVQDAVRQTNRAVDVQRIDLPAVSATGARTIDDLAAGTAELSAMIVSLERATTEIASDPGELGYAFGPAGHKGLRAVFNAVNEGFKLVAGSSELAFGLNWLTPRLAQLNPFLDKLVPLLRSYSAHSTQFNGNIGKVVDVTQNKLIPFAQNGGIALDKITVDSGDTEATRSVASVLRMIGALR
ncbi:MlaD family protein [Gordonia caeni]|uniref:MlaD family protein n=1 Tax=Gordonia caeni TaxID=1007097 RepID=A0ABP7NK49_9ACTN